MGETKKRKTSLVSDGHRAYETGKAFQWLGACKEIHFAGVPQRGADQTARVDSVWGNRDRLSADDEVIQNFSGLPRKAELPIHTVSLEAVLYPLRVFSA